MDGSCEREQATFTVGSEAKDMDGREIKIGEMYMLTRPRAKPVSERIKLVKVSRCVGPGSAEPQFVGQGDRRKGPTEEDREFEVEVLSTGLTQTATARELLPVPFSNQQVVNGCWCICACNDTGETHPEIVTALYAIPEAQEYAPGEKLTARNTDIWVVRRPSGEEIEVPIADLKRLDLREHIGPSE
jgi:hypothetical protein